MVAPVIQFEDVEIDLNRFEVKRGGRKIHLEKQPFDLLVLLVRRNGTLVPRKEIAESLWDSNVFVETDRGINNAIRKIRLALGDDPEHPRFIETVSGRGYRFIASASASRDGQPDSILQQNVSPDGSRDGTGRGIVGTEVDSKPNSLSKSAPASPVATPQKRWLIAGRPTRYVWATIAAVSIGAAVLAIHVNRRASYPNANLNVVPLTSYPGAELYPSFSPDGNEVVFAWNGGESGLDFDLYRKQLGSEKTVRLTTTHAPRIAPAWSPDGQYIAFIRARSGGDHDGLYLISSLGEPPRKLSEVSTAVWKLPSLSWSPDSKWVAFPGRPETPHDYAIAPPAQIQLLNVETLERRTLPYPSPTCTVALAPAFSGNGKEIASYCADESFALGAVYIQSLRGETIRKFPSIRSDFNGLTWTSNSDALVYSVDNSLWRQAATGGIPERLLFGQDASAPTTSRTGNRLVFVRANPDASNLNIWRLNLTESTSPAGVPVRIITSSRNQEQPRISPDGKRIAFTSQRSGIQEIWVADSDGSNPVQLTSFGNNLTGTPGWAPDSRRIVFDSRVSGHAEIYIVDLTGGPPKRMQTGTPDASTPSWSHDGKWIYFSVSVGKAGIWKVPAEGGAPIQLTNDKGVGPQESPDGTHVFYLQRDWQSNNPCALGSVAVNGTDVRSQNCPELHAGTVFIDEWTPGPHGIYFLANLTNPVSLNLLNMNTGKTQHIADIPGRLPDIGSEPSLSADGRTLVFATADPFEGDLMLVEGFR